MQYLIYFAVATPLLLGWLFWQSAHTPPQPAMFHSFADTAHEEAVLRRQAEKEAPAGEKTAAAGRVTQDSQIQRFVAPHMEHTARAASRDNIHLR
jgi:hypothetical protein